MSSVVTRDRAATHTLLGRYEVGDEIGRDSVGVVFRATDTTLKRPVTVKVLHRHIGGDRHVSERFLEIQRRVARLAHPHLATVLDVGEADGGPFVVMEDVAGGSVRHLIDRASPLPVADAVRIVGQVAAAVEALHEDGIVPGDLRPDSVLLDEQGNAKLVDAGMAQLDLRTEVGATAAPSEAATDLAPAQDETRGANAAADVYALGLLAYELLAGRPLFGSEPGIAAADEQPVREPEPLAAARPDGPPGVERVVARALEQDPARRYGSAAQFGEALAQAADAAATQHVAGRRTSASDTTAVIDPVIGPAGRQADDETGLLATQPPIRPAGLRWDALRSALRRRAGAVAGSVRRLPGRVKRMDRRSRAIGLAVIAAGALLLVLVLPGWINPPRSVVVTDLAGKEIGAARELAQQAGVSLRVTEAASATVPKGQVLHQEPPPNTQFLNSRALTLVVSSGPPPVRVPDLRSRRLEDARKDLEAAGLALGKIEERETPRQPWGTVLGQSTRGGSTRPPGTAVDVLVSAPPYTTVPGVAGKAIGEAEAELHRRGLRLGEVRQEAVAGRSAGTVTAQEPAAGVRLRQGDAVAITIAVPPAAPRPPNS